MKNQKMKMTRRQQLIGQMRTALNLLENPLNGDDDSIIFDIAEVEFEFTVKQLSEKSMQYPIGWFNV